MGLHNVMRARLSSVLSRGRVRTAIFLVTVSWLLVLSSLMIPVYAISVNETGATSSVKGAPLSETGNPLGVMSPATNSGFNSTQVPTVDTNGSISPGSAGYVDGKMISLHQEINYTLMHVGVWSSDSSAVASMLQLPTPFDEVTINSYESFTNELPSCSVVAVFGSFNSTLSSETKCKLWQNLRDWVSQGNLLIINDMDLLRSGFSADLGILSVIEKQAINGTLVMLTPNTPLTNNLPQTYLVADGTVTGFVLQNNTNSVNVAAVRGSEERSTFAVAGVRKVGNGFCLFLGLDSGDLCSNSHVINSLLASALGWYAQIQIPVYTKSFVVSNPVSPYVQPMISGDPIEKAIEATAKKFCQQGFNVYYSNLLYTDNHGGYYGELLLQAPLEAYVRLFSSSVAVRYDVSPYAQLTSANSSLSCFTDGLFIRAGVEGSGTLDSSWPPTQVLYYHIAPNKAADADMGTNQWPTHSVEEALAADSERSAFGYDGTGVTVAVIDTGFSENTETSTLYPGVVGSPHPFYQQYYSDAIANRFTGHIVTNLDYRDDSYGHGTGVVSNLLAVAPGVTIQFFPITSDIRNPEIAFQAALAVNPDVITCSWTADSNPTLESLIEQAALNGIVVVFSAGNYADLVWPGDDPSVLSAGGVYVDSSLGLQASGCATSGESVQGIWPFQTLTGRIVPDVCGLDGLSSSSYCYIEMPTQPGSQMDASGDGTSSNDGWWVSCGTSFAAPQVAGLAALVKQFDRSMNLGRVKQILMTTCTDVLSGTSASGYSAAPGFDLATGAGLINCYRTIQTLVQYSSSNTYAKRTLPDGKPANFYSFSGPHGTSYHIDSYTNGGYGNPFNYYFFGYLASRDGAFMTRQDGIRITGWFRQYDTLPQNLWPGRRYVNLYVLSVDGLQVLASATVLGANDGTNWKYVSVTVTGLPGWGMVRIAVGRYNAWSQDWDLTAEWAQVNVYSFNAWSPVTYPSGQVVNWGSSTAPPAYMGTTYHADSKNSNSYNYVFGGIATDYTPTVGAWYTVAVAGWFRQYDTFSPDQQQGRRYLDIYYVQNGAVVSSYGILDYTDGTNWVYRRVVFNLPFMWGTTTAYFVIGRCNAWLYTDYQLTAEWCNVQITIGLSY